MLPVSGKLQLNISGATSDRPMISQSGAYSRFVSPAPCSDSGRKRFQSPAARAARFASSTIGDGVQRVSGRSWCAAIPCSFGQTQRSMNSRTRTASAFTFGGVSKSTGSAPLHPPRVRDREPGGRSAAEEPGDLAEPPVEVPRAEPAGEVCLQLRQLAVAAEPSRERRTLALAGPSAGVELTLHAGEQARGDPGPQQI